MVGRSGQRTQTGPYLRRHSIKRLRLSGLLVVNPEPLTAAPGVE
jgi:hypothetical protein